MPSASGWWAPPAGQLPKEPGPTQKRLEQLFHCRKLTSPGSEQYWTLNSSAAFPIDFALCASTIAWLAYATDCNQPNLTLPRMLKRKGFILRELPAKASAIISSPESAEVPVLSYNRIQPTGKVARLREVAKESNLRWLLSLATSRRPPYTKAATSR